MLLDHSSPSMGTKAAAARSAVGGRSLGRAGEMWKEDGDNYVLTSVSSGSLWLYFVTSTHNILRRKVRLSAEPEPPAPPPPPPLPKDCETVVVTGAGLAAANGDYTKLAARPGVFSKDTNHQIYAVNYTGTTQWHLAHDGVAGSVVYAVANPDAVKEAGTMPPSWGWGLGSPNTDTHVEVAPAPAMLTCKRL